MAEHLPAFQIDNIHFFTSKKGSPPNFLICPPAPEGRILHPHLMMRSHWKRVNCEVSVSTGINRHTDIPSIGLSGYGSMIPDRL
jgi:hypothetical protein